jgi:hypothetical protein
MERPEGDHAVRRPASGPATQGDAIDRARRPNPDAAIHVDRVQHTDNGSPEKWRKL